MYFVRTYKSGGADYDPRQQIFAEFECSVCGEKTDVNVTTNKTFDYSRIRKCPHCKSFDETDQLNSLKKEVELLIEQRENINKKIFELNNKIESFEIIYNSEKIKENVL